MSFLDATDVVQRLYSLLPAQWFPDLEEAPDLNAVLHMLAAAYSSDTDGLWQFLQYTRAQSRVTTATGFWLDLIAQDFFGQDIQRHGSESDISFRRRIILNLLAPKATRCALTCNVQNLTGFRPNVIELRNTGDCGAYASIAEPNAGGGIAYNLLGHYGTLQMPYQLLIDVTRPLGEGIPNVNGYSMGGGGYATYPRPYGFIGGLRPGNFGNGEYVELTQIVGMVTDADIYDTIARTMSAGTTAWTSISDSVEEFNQQAGDMVDVNFYLDISLLAPDDLPVIGGAIGTLIMTIRCHGGMTQVTGGVLTLNIVCVGGLRLGPPVTLSAALTMPTIDCVGAITNAALPITIPITAVGGLRQDIQPVIGTFILNLNRLGPVGVSRMIGVEAVSRAGNVGIFRTFSRNALIATGKASVSRPGTLTTTSINSIANNQVISGVTSITQISQVTPTGSSVVNTTVLGRASAAVVGANDHAMEVVNVVGKSSTATVTAPTFTVSQPLVGRVSVGNRGTLLVTINSNELTNATVLGVTATGQIRTLAVVAGSGTNASLTGVESATAFNAVATRSSPNAFITGRSSTSAIGLFSTTINANAPSLVGQASAAVSASGSSTKWGADRTANLTVSNNNRTLTHTLSVADGARAATGKQSGTGGKVFWEFGVDQNNGTWTVGIANTVWQLNTQVGSDDNSWAVPGSTNGDVISIAFDFNTMQGWSTSATMRAAGNAWNDSPTANPATGVGGADLTPLPNGLYYPAFSSSSSGDATTLNTGQAAFSIAIPSGFRQWDASGMAVSIINNLTPTAPLTGIVSTTRIGNIDTLGATNVNVNLGSISGVAIQGIVTPRFNLTQPITGRSTTLALGSVTTTIPVQRPSVTGRAAIGAVTLPTLSIVSGQNPSIPIIGQTTAGSAGLLLASGGIGQTITGIAGTGNIGTVVARFGLLVPITGRSATRGIGTLTTTFPVQAPTLSGVFSSGKATAPGVGRSITGVNANGAVGKIGINEILSSGWVSQGRAGAPVANIGLAVPLGPFVMGQGVGFSALGAAVASQTWSTTHKFANIQLSNGNLTATEKTTTDNSSVYGLLSANSGKYYWEVTITAANMANITVGIGNVNAGILTQQFVGSNINGLGWLGSDGRVFTNNAPTGQQTATWASYPTGSRLCFALDLNTHQIWGRVGNGLWNNSAAADPAAGTGGTVIPAAVYAAAVTPGVTLNAINDTTTGFFSAGSWTFAAPSSFLSWGTAQTAQPPPAPNLTVPSTTTNSAVLNWTPPSGPTAPVLQTPTNIQTNSVDLTWS